jgi:hypothetical protein
VWPADDIRVFVPLDVAGGELGVGAGEANDAGDGEGGAQLPGGGLGLVSGEAGDLALGGGLDERIGTAAEILPGPGHVGEFLVGLPAAAGPEEPFAPERDVAGLVLPLAAEVEGEAVVAEVEEGIAGLSGLGCWSSARLISARAVPRSIGSAIDGILEEDRARARAMAS